MNSHVDLIRHTTLLRSLSSAATAAYLEDGRFRTAKYNKGEVIHFDGELCNRLEIILSGAVAIQRIDADGNLLGIADLYDDDILGGNLMFSKNPHYPMTVTAMRPAVILAIGKDLLFDLLHRHPDMLRAYLELVADHTTILGDKIKHYVSKTIRESVMGYLLHECKRQQSNHIHLSLSKKELAEKIGVQRTSLSRELAKMREDGLIQFDVDTFTVLKRP